jgi:NTE family protein
VLKGLKNTTLTVDGKKISVLDEVDYISAVSGGSFTAAYYGLH